MLQQLHINASQHTIIYCQVLLMSHTFSVKKPAVLSLLAAVRFSAGVPSYIFRFCLKLLPFFKHSHIFAVKKTYLRNIHCPADMSESKVTFCFTSYSVNAGSLQLRLNPYPLPLPAARPHAFDKYFRFRKASPAQFVLLISHPVRM